MLYKLSKSQHLRARWPNIKAVAVMKIEHTTIAKGASWASAGFAVLQVICLATSILLTRLLVPELFGIMVIINSLRSGIELITDVGLGQSIVYNRSADDPDFYNTAWTVRGIRGILLWLIACAGTVPAAYYYQTPILLSVMPVASFAIVLSGFTSINAFLLQKKLRVAKVAGYEVILSFIWSIEQVALAYFIRTIWALVFGLLLGSATTMVTSYFLLPDVRHRFRLSKRYVWQILHFGKWIFVSSIVYFLSTNFDRLYLAGVIPLALLGIYGIARSIADLLSALAVRLSNIVIFPFIASHHDTPRIELRMQLSLLRLVFFLVAALGFSTFAAFADLAIKLLFDQRYQAAGWMVPVLVIGTWASIFCNVNKSTLLGFGKPYYAAIGSSLKFGWLLVGLPLSLAQYGPLGGILVVAFSDVPRYIPSAVGQIRERFAFWMQDLLLTLIMLSLLVLFEWVRWRLGLGTSFEELPIFK